MLQNARNIRNDSGYLILNDPCHNVNRTNACIIANENTIIPWYCKLQIVPSHSGIIARYTCVSHFTTTVAEHNPCLVIDYSRMISCNLQIAISGNNCVFIHYYTCIYAVDIMVGIIQDKSAGIIWNVSRVLQHALCAETFQIFPRFLKMQIGAIHGRFCQNVSSLLQTALAPNAPGV